VSSRTVPPPPSRRAVRHLRDRLIAGIAVLTPLWVTFVVVSFLFRVARNGSLWLISAVFISPLGGPILALLGTDRAGWERAGLEALPLHGEWLVSLVAIGFTVLGVYVAGVVSALVFGRRALRLLESLLEQVPLVATVYAASKKVVDSFTNPASQPFQEVVLVRFPTNDLRSIGFVTRRFLTSDGRAQVAVFVPTTPNPTTGFLLLVAPSDLEPLPGMTVDKAVESIMSGGVLMPDTLHLSRAP